MISTKGQKIVGYRYGKAPENGRSWNYAENVWECGVSMAQVGFDKEVGSFAVGGASDRKRYYYVGIICGTGGDGEICLEDVKQITKSEYLKMRDEMITVSNQVVNDRINTRIALVHKGWSIGNTEEELENERNKYLK